MPIEQDKERMHSCYHQLSLFFALPLCDGYEGKKKQQRVNVQEVLKKTSGWEIHFVGRYLKFESRSLYPPWFFDCKKKRTVSDSIQKDTLRKAERFYGITMGSK